MSVDRLKTPDISSAGRTMNELWDALREWNAEDMKMATASGVIQTRDIDGVDYVPYAHYGKMMCEHDHQVQELKKRILELETNPAETLCEIDTSSPIAVAQSLINHTTHIPAHEGLFGVKYDETDANTFDVDGLEQIAEHLLVYCRHNREEE